MNSFPEAQMLVIRKETVPEKQFFYESNSTNNRWSISNRPSLNLQKVRN
jgi:hypothetical protein